MTYCPRTNTISIDIGEHGDVVPENPDFKPITKTADGKWRAWASDDILLGEFDTLPEAANDLSLYRRDPEAWIAKNVK